MFILKPGELQYWQRYLSTLPEAEVPLDPCVYASMAGNREIADTLLSLYLSGKKTAGSGLVRDYEHAGDALPAPGNFWMVLNSREIPQCIVKTLKVEIHAFSEVPLDVAIAEGEGDLSLEYWREAHSRFFASFLEKLGIEELGSAQVVTEFFEVVYRG